MKKYLLLILVSALSILMSAQPYPVKNIGGENFYVYTVQSGEGLFAIGRKFGVTQAEIHTANPGLDEGLKAGQELYIPVTTPSTTAQQPTKAAGNYIEHTVAAKQTLYAISKMYGVTVEEIIAVNKLTSESIKIGQVLKIPVANAKTVEAPAPLPKKKIITHEVKRRETLYSISKDYKISINELIEANPDFVNGVKKGDVLNVPVDDTAQQTTPAAATPSVEKQSESRPQAVVKAQWHTVEKGETVYRIARKYGVPVEQIYDLNPATREGIKEGDVIMIGPPKGTKEPRLDAGEDAKPAFGQHVVKRGETIYSISRLYNIEPNELLGANPDAQSGIKPGDTLTIPTQKTKTETAVNTDNKLPSAATTAYQVKEGETLYGISRQFGISVDQLLALNPELNGGVRKGDLIRVPATDAAAATIAKMTPQTGDSDTAISLAQPHLKVLLLMPFMTDIANLDGSADRFVEFYKGVLIALNDVKRAGISVELQTYDIGKETDVLDTLLLRMKKAPDLIIGPAFPSQVHLVSEYALKNQVYMVVPFTSKIDDVDRHDRLFQFNSTFDELFAAVSAHIAKDYPKHTFVIARFKDSEQNKGNQFADVFKQTLRRNKIMPKEFEITPDNVDTLNTLIGSRKAVLLLASNSVADVAPIIPRLRNLSLPSTLVFGFEEWGSELVSQLPNVSYYSLFAPNQTESYDNLYQQWFGTRKSAVHPYYDLLGYDITYYFCTGLLRRENGTLALRLTPEVRLMQSMFNFKKNRTNGSYINRSFCILNWDGVSLSQPQFYE